MAGKTKMLEFGGPGLPPGTHTYYEMRDEHGKAKFIDRVEAGHVVEASKVVKIISDDSKQDIPTADGYVQRGQASFVEMTESTAPTAKS